MLWETQAKEQRSYKWTERLSMEEENRVGGELSQIQEAHQGTDQGLAVLSLGLKDSWTRLIILINTQCRSASHASKRVESLFFLSIHCSAVAKKDSDISGRTACFNRSLLHGAGYVQCDAVSTKEENVHK